LTLENKTLCSIEMLGITNNATWCNNTKDMNPEHQCCVETLNLSPTFTVQQEGKKLKEVR